MRFSNSTSRPNANLLYTQFKKVEEYEKDSPDIADIERRYTHQKTPSLSLKKRASRKPLELIQYNDDFNNLSLEKQVEVVMRPITNPGKKAENLLRMMEDREISKVSSKETEKFMLETEDFELNNRTDTRNILKDLKFQSNSTKATKSAKESISLPPVKDIDPLFTTQTAKHWHYHEPLKNSPRNVRASILNADTLNSTKKNDTISKLSVDKSNVFFSQNKRRSKTRSGLILNSEASVQRNIDTQNTSSSSRIYRVRELSLSSKRRYAPNENLLASLTPNNVASEFLAQFAEAQLFSTENREIQKETTSIQNTDEEGNNVLNILPVSNRSQAPSGNIISLGQLKSRTLALQNKKSTGRLGVEDEKTGISIGKIDTSKLSIMTRSKSQAKPFSTVAMNSNEMRSPGKKKEYYGKWFMPVKQWKVLKETTPIGKKYDELKKDINYFYHNLHNYTAESSASQTRENFRKNEYKINFDNLQEKLKQNLSVKKFKKQLVDNEQRIPNFLKGIEEGIISANQ